MIQNARNIQILFLVFALAAIGSFSSCKKKNATIPKSDLEFLPSYTGLNYTTVMNDSGLVQLKMFAPLVEKYDNNVSPYTEFKSGIKVIFYDGKPQPMASVVSKYAKYTSSDNVWELRDSVVVINSDNDKLETEQLYWDQTSDKIHTTRFVKITSEDQIIMGIGFESDSHLQQRIIYKITAEIYLPDEK